MQLDHFIKNVELIPQVLIGTVIIYILIIVYTRIFGLKSFSKMTGFDFITTVAIGNLMAMSINTGSPSLAVGAVLILVLYLLNYLFTILTFKSPGIRRIIDNKPILLMLNGEFLQENMKITKVTDSEIRGKLREANVITMDQVKAVVLETTGDVSVLHSDKEIELEEYLLEGVER